jgi:hypothetical protein
MKMDTIAEFKRRCKPGSKWLMTNTLTGSQFVREVKRKQTNAVIFFTDEGTETWLTWPKRDETTFEGDLIKIKLGGGNVLSYRRIEKQKEST